MHDDGPFTRYGMKPSIVFPGTLGATNWHGGSYDPKLNYIFYNIINLADVGMMVPTPPGSPLAYQRSGPSGPMIDSGTARTIGPVKNHRGGNWSP